MSRGCQILTFLAAVVAALHASSALAGGNVPYLVKDINPSGFSSPIELAKVGNRLFFNADDGVHGQELWVSDGSDAGTYMVVDLIPGPDGSVPQRIVDLNGLALFQVDDNVDGMQWYVSDGTAQGTVSIASVEQGGPGIAKGTCGFWGIEAVTVGAVTFFEGDDPQHGKELWKTDGTTQGTVLVQDIIPGTLDGNIQVLRRVGGLLYFACGAGDSVPGFDPWRSDGTAAGTIRLADIGGALRFTDVEGVAYFRGDDPATGEELWISDGTPEGTRLVKDINPGINPSSPESFVNVGGTLFFNAFAAGFGREVWKSDGTEEGTIMVADITPGSGSGSVSALTNVGGTLFFRRLDAGVGWQIWTSDGTSEGTVLVKTIGPTDADPPDFLTAANGKLYFSADDGIHGEELWVSDGTTAGTNMVYDLNPGPGYSAPVYLTVVGSHLFFVAGSPASGGAELFAYDTSEATIPAASTMGVIVLGAGLLVAAALVIRTRSTSGQGN